MKSNLGNIGERNAIDIIRGILEPSSDLGKGDDCAVLEFGEDYLLITTDVIVEGMHFPSGTDGYSVGWLVVAVNLSDIAAMGGRPLGVVVSAALPKTTETSYLKSIARGMKACASRFGTEVVGGDTKHGRTTTLSGCALGVVPKKGVLVRRGTKPGDVLAVTGTLGLAAVGYHSLKGKARRGSKKAVEALLKPRPLVNEGMVLSGTGMVTACMDLSDSLASSIHQMSKASGVGFKVDYGKLPIAKEALARGIDRKKAALYFGGDYQLLITTKKKDFPEVKKALKKLGTNLTAIGKATKKGDKVLIMDNKIEPLENTSYEHFR